MDEQRVRSITRQSMKFSGNRRHISTYLPADVAGVFTRLAEAEGMSLAHATRAAIADWMVATAKRRKKATAK